MVSAVGLVLCSLFSKELVSDSGALCHLNKREKPRSNASLSQAFLILPFPLRPPTFWCGCLHHHGTGSPSRKQQNLLTLSQKSAQDLAREHQGKSFLEVDDDSPSDPAPTLWYTLFFRE